MQNRK